MHAAYASTVHVSVSVTEYARSVSDLNPAPHPPHPHTFVTSPQCICPIRPGAHIKTVHAHDHVRFSIAKHDIKTSGGGRELILRLKEALFDLI